MKETIYEVYKKDFIIFGYDPNDLNDPNDSNDSNDPNDSNDLDIYKCS